MKRCRTAVLYFIKRYCCTAVYHRRGTVVLLLYMKEGMLNCCCHKEVLLYCCMNESMDEWMNEVHHYHHCVFSAHGTKKPLTASRNLSPLEENPIFFLFFFVVLSGQDGNAGWHGGGTVLELLACILEIRFERRLIDIV